VEKVHTIDTFLPANPLDLLNNGTFHKVPWMIGVNSGEGLLNTGRKSCTLFQNLQLQLKIYNIVNSQSVYSYSIP